MAPEDLVGVQVGTSPSNGNYLIGQSRDGIRTYAFLHLSEQPAPGDRDEGFIIGKVGNTGYVLNNNVHLHLSVIVPEDEAAKRGLRTLPAYPGYVYVSFKELAKQGY